MIDIAIAIIVPIMVLYSLTLPKFVSEEPYSMEEFRKDIFVLTIDDILDKCDRLGLPWKATPTVTDIKPAPAIVGAWSSASTAVFPQSGGTITITNNSPMTLTEITVSAMSTACTNNANFATYDMTGYTFEYGERREI